MDNESLRRDEAALVESAGLVDFGRRTRIELAGEDRAKFLHNLCTADVRNLSPDAGCEAFLTNVQGKTIGYGFVFNDAQSLRFETVEGQAPTILAHFDRYLIREKVELSDATSSRSEWLLAGPSSENILAAVGAGHVPVERLQSGDAEIADVAVRIRRVDMAGPIGFIVECQRDAADAVGEELVAGGATRCGHAAFEAARIAAGFPRFGADITDKNLPQEVARDALAISFNKGCYLGQETVARIDALGHVNRTLVGVLFAGASVPAAGDELLHDGAVVGHVTSALFSPRRGVAIALLICAAATRRRERKSNRASDGLP